MDTIDAEDFEALRPWSRGFYVYLYGARYDQPNIPDESNPYPPGSKAAEDWTRGALAASLQAQEGDD